MEKAQGPDLKFHENSATMVGRDVLNNRIVVSLWTIQVVTVLFVVVSMAIWLALGTGIPLDNPGLVVLGIYFLAILMATIFAEFRLYVLHILSIEIYLRLQVVKVISWAMVLLIVLEAASGVEDMGIKVFMEAAKKLM
jgi:hypothetical protein